LLIICLIHGIVNTYGRHLLRSAGVMDALPPLPR